MIWESLVTTNFPSYGGQEAELTWAAGSGLAAFGGCLQMTCSEWHSKSYKTVWLMYQVLTNLCVAVHKCGWSWGFLSAEMNQCYNKAMHWMQFHAMNSPVDKHNEPIYRVAQKKRPEHSHALFSRMVKVNQHKSIFVMTEHQWICAGIFA